MAALSSDHCSPVSSHFDTVIIGAGMSGLAAGIRLAHFGQRVCILERHTTIGGLNSFYRLGGRNYDVGLHAVTNFSPKGTKRGPLARVLRQLRFSWDDFELREQLGSRISFPDVSLRFDNDPELLYAEVERAFPGQGPKLRELVATLPDYEALDSLPADLTARDYLSRHLTEPMLIEMLLCPLMYYGNAREHDMDFPQFCIMFRSLFLEGFSRPWSGVRVILKALTRRYKELGGELWLRRGVRDMQLDGNQIAELTLDDGATVTADRVLSSAGYVETMRLCGRAESLAADATGILSFVEVSAILDRQPRDIDYRDTIVFFSDSERFIWERPSTTVDIRSGVICSPNNYAFEEPLPEGIVRVTALANFDQWRFFDEAAYVNNKSYWRDKMLAAAVGHVPDFRPYITDGDTFTPTTIRRYTGHDNGAVYGAPQKRYDGTTPFENLFLCGTDQGFVGIVGALVSGIAMANLHCLKATHA